MTWSTRELAELAGTTLNAVRHYHHGGLLDQPSRSHNGYKQYEVRHLVRLLFIRRLRDLGVPLDRIPQAGAAQRSMVAVLSAVDEELETNIERLQLSRAAIGAILRGSSPGRAPASGRRLSSRHSLVLLDSSAAEADTSHVNY